MITYKSKIIITDYILNLYIGVTEKERSCRQQILLSVEVKFKKLPQATKTDDINDTISYHKLCNKLIVFNNSTFCTIEYLGMEIYKMLYKLVIPNNLRVEIKKLPVIKNLLGGVKFIIDT